jgi:hypothetical protein
MRYTELNTWEDFAKALSQNPDPRILTYLIEGLNRGLGMDERKEYSQPFSPRIVLSGAKAKRSDLL